MINIQPYHDKLNALEEYLHLSIDERAFDNIYIDLSAVKPFSYDEVMVWLNSTGFLVCRGIESQVQNFPNDFETWYNNKLNNTSK